MGAPQHALMCYHLLNPSTCHSPVNVPANNPRQPPAPVLPPAYRDYRLDANPGPPAPVPAVPDNPPPYRPLYGPNPPYGPPYGPNPPYEPNPPGDPRGWGNPNWNAPWGYPQRRQFPDHARDPKLS